MNYPKVSFNVIFFLEKQDIFINKDYDDGKQLSSSKNVYMEAKGNSHQKLVLGGVEKKDVEEYTSEAIKDDLVDKIQVPGTDIFCIYLQLLFLISHVFIINSWFGP